MCGIVGVRWLDGREARADTMIALADLLEHRGPDDRSVWVDGPVGFGHRRLSIIDVGGSAQPMTSGSGRFTITFNGEILNYRQLRSRLDYPFRTDGDTETILALFETSGGAPDLARLAGQFAFCVYDHATDTMTLARDRLGILPLYTLSRPEVAAFASEPKALLPLLPDGPVLCEDALADYLTFRSVPPPGTLYQGIRKVAPGVAVTVGPSGSSVSRRYWALPGPDDVLDLSPAQAVDRVDEALKAGVREALIADVPVGAYLSGGVDSSLIVALATQERGGPVDTFSAGFSDPRFDELPYAAQVSRAVGSNHHPVHIGPEDFFSDWERLSQYRDGPLSEPADVAVAALARAASSEVKVVLSGEGSDELFAGYPKYRYARLVEAVASLPASVRGPAATAMADRLPARGRRARVLLRALAARSVGERLETWFAPFPADAVAQLAGGVSRTPRVPAPEGRDIIDVMLRSDTRTWLSDNLLERGDRMTMSASVELRPPFLSTDLVDLAFRLPSDLKVRGRTTKWVVKEVARRHLPAEIVDRPKVGFRVPLDAWFRDDLRHLAADLIYSPHSIASTRLDASLVRRIVDDHFTSRRSEELALWTLLSLELWNSSCIAGWVRPEIPGIPS